MVEAVIAAALVGAALGWWAGRDRARMDVAHLLRAVRKCHGAVAGGQRL